MEFADSPEQAALRDAIRSFARRNVTPYHVRASLTSPVGYDPRVWERLSAELGLTGLAVPERYGGAGAGPGEVAVAVEELGRVLLPSPYLSTAIVALALAGSADDGGRGAAERYLPGLADGSLVGALALHADVTATSGKVTGVARNVVDGAVADLLLVRSGPRLLAVVSADAAIEPLETLDQTRRQAVVQFDHVSGIPAGPAAPTVALQRVLLAAECVAAAEHCLAVTTDYLKTRHQFGRPIGSFQALKHRAADLAVAVASARATARAAVWAAAVDPAGLAGLAPLAALYCSQAFVQVAAEMIQMHGGIAFTWEHEAHLYFKRAKSTQLLLGSVSALRNEIGREAGLLPGHADGRIVGQSAANDLDCHR
jgi:alkylation response protein AidB-like acyl-CoA dehydrogenase